MDSYILLHTNYTKDKTGKSQDFRTVETGDDILKVDNKFYFCKLQPSNLLFPFNIPDLFCQLNSSFATF